MLHRYVGWQIGVNYQAPAPEGIDWPYLNGVIDRSADCGMNLLGLMMVSYASHCPAHDGYAWPVRNPRLEPLREKACLNANASTEFVAKALDYAKRKGSHCQLMMNGGIADPAKVALRYPDAASQCLADGKPRGMGYLVCPDSPGGLRLFLDEVTDLLAFYRDSPVDSFAFERLSYTAGTCFCPYSREKFARETATTLGESPLTHLVWKGNAMRAYLREYASRIREVRPGIEIWAHTGGEPDWGRFPHVLRDVGIDVISNHGQHFLPTKEAFHQQLDWLEPFLCAPHRCVRDKPTHNYSVARKTPEMIRRQAGWLEDYPGDRVIGAVFFNEVHTSERNKAAVYEIAVRWMGGA